jgi:translation initiation factor 4E
MMTTTMSIGSDTISSPVVPSNPYITVLEDPKNYTVKHPLQHTWKLWYKEKVAEHAPSPASGETSSWQSSLKSVDDISTVEDFWGWFNVMPKPSDIKHGGDIFLFHQNIEPSWEDPAHSEGSSLTWTLRQPPSSSSGGDNKEYLDYWLNAMLSCIGCSMTVGWEHVTGVQFAARDRGSRITLWLRTSNREIVQIVDAEFKKALVEGLSSVNAADIHLKWEEFSNQLARQQHYQPRRTSNYQPRGGGEPRPGRAPQSSSSSSRYFR